MRAGGARDNFTARHILLPFDGLGANDRRGRIGNQHLQHFFQLAYMAGPFPGFIKVKVERDIEVPAEHVELLLPAENCCVYADDILI
ncbi:MAG TPA: hypothetical protein DDZ82_13290 [Rhodobacteraceae bacterium]|nr:hypothetical protein [Paracoccaceae bacterium]